MPQNDTIKSQIKLHFVVFLWGFTAILGDLILLDALPLVAYRMIIAVIGIYLYLKFKNTPTGVKGSMRWKLYGAGMVIAAHWVLFFHAIKISNVSITLACMGSAALFVSILEPIFFKRKVATSEIFLGVLVVIGVSTIFWSESDYTLGIIVALISASLSAMFSVINGLLVKKESSAVITVHELLGGSLAVALYISGQLAFFGREVSSIIPTLSDLGWLLILGLAATAYAFIQAVDVMRHLSPFTVVLTINMEPIYGIIAAYLIFGESEKMSTEFYLGASIIIVAVVMNGYFKRKQKRRLQKESA